MQELYDVFMPLCVCVICYHLKFGLLIRILLNLLSDVCMFCFFSNFSTCCTNAVLFQDWGKPGDLWNLGIQWHVPSSDEVAFAFYLLDSFLQPELIKLQHCGDGELEMSRLVFFYNQLVLHDYRRKSFCVLSYLIYLFSVCVLNIAISNQKTI